MQIKQFRNLLGALSTVTQILAQSDNPRLSYSELNIKNLGAVLHLGFQGK